MNYETVEPLRDGDFKRLTGVQRKTFEQMRAVIEKGLPDIHRLPFLAHRTL